MRVVFFSDFLGTNRKKGDVMQKVLMKRK